MLKKLRLEYLCGPYNHFLAGHIIIFLRTKGLGINSKHLKAGLQEIADRNEGKVIAGLQIGTLYADFKEV